MNTTASNKTNKKYYGVLIATDPQGSYAFRAGWDQTFTDLATAKAVLAGAKQRFCGAKLTSANESDARRFGWLPAQEVK
jgi:hypothetical protein